MFAGFFKDMIDDYHTSDQEQSVILEWDGKLMKSKLTPTKGDADYIGHEVSVCVPNTSMFKIYIYTLTDKFCCHYLSNHDL